MMIPSRRSRSTRLWVASVAVLAPFGAAAGCSLTNAFDDVKPQTTGDSGPTADTSTGDGASDGGGDVVLVDAPVLDADAGPLPPTGAIVVGAQQYIDASEHPGFLTVLNPATGAELGARETMKVIAVSYDGLRDLWYVFETNTKPFFGTAGPIDKVDLHVRTLDTHTGAWTNVYTVTVPTPVFAETIAVLRERIVYPAYVLNDGGAPTTALIVLSTSVPTAVTVASSTPLAAPPGGAIGTRASSNPGGSYNMLSLDNTSCVGDGGFNDLCELKLTHVNIPSGAAPAISAPTTIGAVPKSGAAGGGTYLSGPDDVIAFPPAATNPGGSAYVRRYSPSNSAPLGSAIQFPIAGTSLKPLAVAECLGTALVIDLKADTELFAIPLTPGGSIPSKSLGHPGRGVIFEPYTSKALAWFANSAIHEITAFSLAGTATAPTLTKLQGAAWSPPADLEPNYIGVKAPIPFACP